MLILILTFIHMQHKFIVLLSDVKTGKRISNMDYYYTKRFWYCFWLNQIYWFLICTQNSSISGFYIYTWLRWSCLLTEKKKTNLVHYPDKLYTRWNQIDWFWISMQFFFLKHIWVKSMVRGYNKTDFRWIGTGYQTQLKYDWVLQLETSSILKISEIEYYIFSTLYSLSMFK